VTHSKTSLASDLGENNMVLFYFIKRGDDASWGSHKNVTKKVTGWHHIHPVFCYVGNMALMLRVSKLLSVCKRTGAKNGFFTLPFTWTFQQLRGHQRNIMLSVSLGAFVDFRSDSVNSFRTDSTDSHSCPRVFIFCSIFTWSTLLHKWHCAFFSPKMTK